ECLQCSPLVALPVAAAWAANRTFGLARFRGSVRSLPRSGDSVLVLVDQRRRRGNECSAAGGGIADVKLGKTKRCQDGQGGGHGPCQPGGGGQNWTASVPKGGGGGRQDDCEQVAGQRQASECYGRKWRGPEPPAGLSVDEQRESSNRKRDDGQDRG